MFNSWSCQKSLRSRVYQNIGKYKARGKRIKLLYNVTLFWKLVALTLFPADAVFANFRASLVVSTPFPFRLFIDRFHWSFFSPYNVSKTSIEIYQLPKNRLSTRVLTFLPEMAQKPRKARKLAIDMFLLFS